MHSTPAPGALATFPIGKLPAPKVPFPILPATSQLPLESDIPGSPEGMITSQPVGCLPQLRPKSAGSPSAQALSSGLSTGTSQIL